MDPAIGCFVFNVFGYLFNYIRGIRCNTIVAVVLPNGAGKSEIVKRLQSDSYHLLDIESQVALTLTETEREQLKNMDNARLFYYPKCKKYLVDVKNAFPHQAIIVLCSNVALCKYLNIKRVLSFIPDNNFLNAMTSRMDDEENKNRLISSRLEILTQTKAKDNIVYSNFEMLYSLLSQKLKLKPKL